MKKKYEEPQTEIIRYSEEDVILTTGECDDNVCDIVGDTSCENDT